MVPKRPSEGGGGSSQEMNNNALKSLEFGKRPPAVFNNISNNPSLHPFSINAYPVEDHGDPGARPRQHGTWGHPHPPVRMSVCHRTHSGQFRHCTSRFTACFWTAAGIHSNGVMENMQISLTGEQDSNPKPGGHGASPKPPCCA